MSYRAAVAEGHSGHTDYFILAGAVAAFHRLMTVPQVADANAEDGNEPLPEFATLAGLTALARQMPQLAGMGPAAALPMSSIVLSETAVSPRGIPARFDSAEALEVETEDDLTLAQGLV